VDILLNGHSTGNANGAQFVAWTALTINSGFFVAGVNTLDFIVNNGGGPTGLRVEISGTADPTGTTIPEPVSFVLLGAGLGALGMLRRRKV
jgi:hypothetical protein